MSPGHMEPIIGRYIKVPVMGEECRVYFEEAGQGIPLVCLHTAGADSRQFRHLRCDEAVTKDFRVIAFDLPWHGKSYPPVGWEKREYRLATDLYVATIRAFCAALGLRRPVALGCSIGGRIVLQLAHAHGSEFRALIGQWLLPEICKKADTLMFSFKFRIKGNIHRRSIQMCPLLNG